MEFETGAIEVEEGVDVEGPEGSALTIVTDSDVTASVSEIHDALKRSGELAAITEWVTSMRTFDEGAPGIRKGSLIQRDQYVTPTRIFDQFRTARLAAENDDTVAGVIDATESLAFSKIKFDHEDGDQEDIWNQLGKKWDLDSLLRRAWRDLFIYSQFIIAATPGDLTLKVRGRGEAGAARRKTFNLTNVPVAFRLLDPFRVVPFGNPLFGEERLAWLATREEADGLDRMLATPEIVDPARNLIIRRLSPVEFDRLNLEELSHNIGKYAVAYEMNPAWVYRHTDTKPDYLRFAPVKMKSVFPLLDLKHLLRANDRTLLVGAINFLILVKKGSDQMPAKKAELEALRGVGRSIAKMPLLVGDHRLNVEIIAPKTDQLLKPERYNTLNSTITARLYLLFSTGGYTTGTGRDSSSGLMRMVARGLESRRHMIRRTLEKFVIDRIVEQNDSLTSAPTLRYQPASISLEFDQARASFLLELRQSRELSRETLLTEFDFDQDDEARRLEIEAEKYDDLFKTINPFNQGQPGSGDTPADNRQAGRMLGGLRGGGGNSTDPRHGGQPNDA